MKLKNITLLLLVATAFNACKNTDPAATSVDTTPVQKDTLRADVSTTDSVGTSKKTTLTATKLEHMPGELQSFIHAITDVEKIANYIDTSIGCYLIEEGPGIYPIFKKVASTNDLMANSEFVLMVNSSLFPNHYYLDQQDLDPCSPPEEGMFFNASKKNDELLFSIYESYLSGTGEKPEKEIKDKLTKLSSTLSWQVTINLPTKTGDLNTFVIHLVKANGKLLIAAVDTRNCGA